MLVTRATPGPRAAVPAEKKPPQAVPVDETKKRFEVLFVDDSMSFLDSFGGLCEEFSRFTWKIHKATSADTALSVLQSTPIDLILLDIGMPMLDGLQLLRIINRRHPGLKIAVITGNATESRRADALAHGAEMFLEKPVTPEGMQSTFNLLLDLLLLKREGFTGALKHVNLQEVIQVECMSRRSSIMEIRNLEFHGRIYLEDGAVVHALAGELSGEPAFRRLMALRGGEFQLKQFQPPPQRTIGAPWEFLLMNSTEGPKEAAAMLKQTTPENPHPPPAAEVVKPVVARSDAMPIPVLEPEKPPEVNEH
jgi:CheY-like chemotaxis protein